MNRRLAIPAVFFGLLATLAASPAIAQQNRPTVALMDFDYGTVQRWWEGNEDIGQGIADMLVDELVNDGSYRVIERKRLQALLAEQNFSNSERAEPNAKTVASLGKMLGVKYLIVGSVTKFGTEDSSKSVGGGAFGGISFGSSDFRSTILGEATEGAVKDTATKLINAKSRLQ